VVRNESANIRKCLESLDWVDEIVVVDSGSTDDTVEICRSYPCRLIEHEWMGFGPTKRFAAESARHDWVLSIDGDEVVSPDLRERIRGLLSGTPEAQGYRIRFRSFYLGREIRHCGRSNEFHLRLFNRKHGNYTDRPLHESVQLRGRIEELRETILHYTHPTIAVHLEKIQRYSELGARQLFELGRGASPLGAVARGISKFLKMYLIRAGFLDGAEGLILSALSGYAVCCKYILLWEMHRWKRSS